MKWTYTDVLDLDQDVYAELVTWLNENATEVPE